MPNSFTTTYLIYPSLEMPIYFYFKLKTRDIVYFLQLYLFAKHIMCLKLDMLRFMQFSFLFLSYFCKMTHIRCQCKISSKTIG